MIRVLAESGNDHLARVFSAQTSAGGLVEFVESVQPPVPLYEKWVLIISTLYGCPVGCLFCDAGNFYEGMVSADDILAQIEYLVRRRFPGGVPGTRRLKIQFARMGEPSLNPAVLTVLERLPHMYPADILFPALSTIAPAGAKGFFEELMRVKNRFYGRRFQLQFSIHSTDHRIRDRLMPAAKWNLETIADYGALFHREGERKVTLNFALAENTPVDAGALRRHFDPDIFLIKVTPVNPTYQAVANRITSSIGPGAGDCHVIRQLRECGYEVLLSIGELEENHIGSNCGQHLTHYLNESRALPDSYTYPIH